MMNLLDSSVAEETPDNDRSMEDAESQEVYQQKTLILGRRQGDDTNKAVHTVSRNKLRQI
jgi:hypothetical protein